MTDRKTYPGRPRSFDEAKALEQAMQVFWTHGYGGASYPLLEEATGLHRQSLRYAFGDKAALFCSAIELYSEQKVGGVLEMLKRPGSALANIKCVLDHWTDCVNDPSRRGCLLVNSMAELGQDEEFSGAAIDRANRKLVFGLVEAFATAQEQGTVRKDLDAETLGRQAVAMGDGFMLHARSGEVADFARAAFDNFLKQVSL